MNTRLLLSILAANALVVAALVVWASTGLSSWTRYPSEGIAETQSAPAGGDLGDLFAEAGLNDDHGELEEIDNAFRFGLLPSGPGRGALSVASVLALAVLAQLAAVRCLRTRAPEPGDAVALEG